jgi:glycosyltransferase involved in cell wall biosynthesis
MVENNKIKICFIHSNPFGVYDLNAGPIVHMTGFAEGIKEAGGDIFFISPNFVPLYKNITRVVIVRFDKIFQSFVLNRLLYTARFLFRGTQIIKYERPTVLYERYGYSNIAGVILAKLFRIPIVMEVNTPLGIYTTKQELGKFYHLALLAERFVLRNATYVTTVSQEAKEILLSRYPGLKVVVNENGVNPRRFSPEVSGKRPRERFALKGKFIIGYSGSLMWWHGIPILFKAMEMVRRKLPEAHLLLMGDSGLRQEYEALTKRLSIDEVVTFAGFVSYEKMPGYLAACDVLVAPYLPTLAEVPFHGSPIKVFEYMAMAKPVVASNLGQISAILKHRETGLLVRPGDADELADAIIELREDPILALKLGGQARTESMNYTWKGNGDRFLDEIKWIRSDAGYS